MTVSTDFTYVEQGDLKRFAIDALMAMNATQEVAELTAHAIWLASIRGVDSHGMRLLPHYIAAIEGGRLNPQPEIQFAQTAPATGILDADHTIGHYACTLAMRHAVELAKIAGMGIVVVKNSSHNGSMASYGLQAAYNDMIGIVMTNASPSVRVPNSKARFFGTNPTCITAPMLNEEPFCFDAAPTPFTANKVRQYAEDGRPLPDGVGATGEGQPTNDASQAILMLPIGDYKGFGFIMMADVLTSLLSGMPSGDEITGTFNNRLWEKRYLAQVCMAIRIDAFRDLTEFKTDLQRNADKIRSLPRLSDDVPVMVPGDPEKKTMMVRMEQGIPVKPFDMDNFRSLASKLNITMPKLMD